MLNKIVWNRTVFRIQTPKSYLTELFEIELFICTKMDLVLMTYNGWCAIKQTKPNQNPDNSSQETEK